MPVTRFGLHRQEVLRAPVDGLLQRFQSCRAPDEAALDVAASNPIRVPVDIESPRFPNGLPREILSSRSVGLPERLGAPGSIELHEYY